MSRLLKRGSGWQSGGEKIRSEERENLSRAFENGWQGVRDGVQAISASDRGKLLLLGDILLQLSETIPGRTLVALFSLWGAWALLG